MTTLREAAQPEQAEPQLCNACYKPLNVDNPRCTTDDHRAPEAEPVAWYSPANGLPYGMTENPPTADAVYLYASPPTRTPMSEAQIAALQARVAELEALLLDARDSLCTHTDAYDIALIGRIDVALEGAITKKKRTTGELKRIWIQVDKNYLKFAEVLQQ